MSLNIYTVAILLLFGWISAENTTKKDPAVAEPILTIIGLIFGSAFVTFGLISIVYVTMKFIKRKMSEPQYCIDDTSSNKDGSDYHHDNDDDVYSQVPHINQIRPTLAIPKMLSSIKQSLDDLRISLIPFSWSRAQHIYDQRSPSKEKKDLPV